MSRLAHTKRFSKRQASPSSAGCSISTFYESPTQNENVDTSQMLDIKWSTSAGCFSTQGVDIYLYAPYTEKGLLHVWQGIDYNAGSFQTPIDGSWWNSTSPPISLQLDFVQSNEPIFTSPIGNGPLFTATFNATDYELKHPVGGPSSNSTSTPSSSDGSSSGSSGIFQIIDNAYKNLGLPKGDIAAAVLVPLIVIAVAIAFYIRYYRKKEAEKRKRWSEAVDKRMSTISSDWKSLPAGTQSEAIRQSIAIMRNSRASMARMSQAYGPDIRPVSIMTTQSGSMTGVGMRKGTGVGLRNPALGPAQMAARKSVASYASTNRKSAISFAADTRFNRSSEDIPNVPDLPAAIPRPRPSIDTQHSRGSRAFHTAFTAEDAEEFEIMSPVQKKGPVPVVSSDDLKTSVFIKDQNVLPALNMLAVKRDDELLFTSSPLEPSFSPIASPPPSKLSPSTPDPFTDHTPYSPSYGNVSQSSLPPPDPVAVAMAHAPVYVSPISHPPAVATTNSPFAGFAKGPAAFTSPDDMFKAYASGSALGTPMAFVPRPVSTSTSASATSNANRPITPTRAISFKSLKRTSSNESNPKNGARRLTNGSNGSSASVKYSAFDAPAAPEPIVESELENGGSGSRVVYTPYRGVQRNSDESSLGYGVAK